MKQSRDVRPGIHGWGASPRSGLHRLGSLCGAVAVVALVLSGCGDIFQHADTSSITLRVLPDANENSAVEVDVVAVYDQDLLKTLLTVPARDWFVKRDQFALDFPNGFKAWNWQVVPGQEVPTREIASETDKAYGVLVFANYRSAGDHRARIGSLSEVTITLQKDGFVVAAPPE